MLRKLLSLSVLFLSPWATTASAQCFGPDGLDGPCWVPTQANLPNLPAVSIGGLGVCWTSCNPQQQNISMSLQSPQFVKCGQYTTRLDAFDVTGTLQLSGIVNLDYTRTWGETSPGANPRRVQVYRFVAKVDLRRAAANPPPCLVPSCIATWQTAFYYGYVDYAFDCVNGTVESVISLFHNCDAYIHKNGLSSKPGVFHPNTSFALIGPHSAINPFVPSNRVALAGPMTAEAMRSVTVAAGATCITEDPIVAGNIKILGAGCGCTLNLNPLQLTARHMEGFGACVDPVGNSSSFRSLKTFPNLPWYEVMTTSLGSWTTDLSYPGREHAWVDEGPFLMKDACSAALGGNRGWGEIYYGASTSEGWFVQPTPVNLLTQNFTDLAANLSFRIPGPVPFPMVGSVLPTRNLIYTNVP